MAFAAVSSHCGYARVVIILDLYRIEMTEVVSSYLGNRVIQGTITLFRETVTSFGIVMAGRLAHV